MLLLVRGFHVTAFGELCLGRITNSEIAVLCGIALVPQNRFPFFLSPKRQEIGLSEDSNSA